MTHPPRYKSVTVYHTYPNTRQVSSTLYYPDSVVVMGDVKVIRYAVHPEP